MTRRRFVLTSVAGVLAAAGPVAAQREGAPRRIGYVGNTPRTPVTDAFWEAFVTGLRELGWVEPRTVLIERRYVEPRDEAAAGATGELIRAGVEVIVVASTQAALAARRTAATLPIVITVPGDPVAVGLVASLARPGGNVTGLSFVGTEVASKQVELLRETVRGLAAIGVLANPTNASHAPRVDAMAAAARALALRVDVVEARRREEVAGALPALVKRGAGAAVVLTDPMLARETDALVRIAAEQRLPVMYGLREAPLAGGLMSYGPSFAALFHRAASYVDRILRGARPADLPVEQPTTFELVVNVRTARALGLTIPPSVLLRADQVVE
jgi:putative ABC transport system substrate-binding protein